MKQLGQSAGFGPCFHPKFQVGSPFLEPQPMERPYIFSPNGRWFVGSFPLNPRGPFDRCRLGLLLLVATSCWLGYFLLVGLLLAGWITSGWLGLLFFQGLPLAEALRLASHQSQMQYAWEESMLLTPMNSPSCIAFPPFPRPSCVCLLVVNQLGERHALSELDCPST